MSDIVESVALASKLRVWAEEDVEETARDGTLEANDIYKWAQMMREAADCIESLCSQLSAARDQITKVIAYVEPPVDEHGVWSGKPWEAVRDMASALSDAQARVEELESVLSGQICWHEASIRAMDTEYPHESKSLRTMDHGGQIGLLRAALSAPKQSKDYDRII